ncbi:antibiotic biosynthesis monooxygenase family protein [Segetibacter sp.]|jgi:quinol monooxygenase YgiN|uniref:putative quinol monooxygenase n=1 Tax=Segetibacter sp. TaxID=2231182 RepID=UPI002603465D|nr:antibiotic biosynthesis monooxygenase family protein [Segetibacter sp.]
MLVRMVKMTFRADAVEAFKVFFEERKEKIRNFEGCTHLELWQDNHDQNIFFTYSNWQDEAALTHYRNSSFFRDTWQLTRPMFSAKAEAWSVNQLAILP